MNLRPYQERAVAAVAVALEDHESTLLVAPTSSGKSLLVAACAAEQRERLGRPTTALVLQHRGELVAQNRSRFEKHNRGWATASFDADRKSFARPSGYLGAATFAMVPSLAAALGRGRGLPPFDIVLADEAHHAPASTWQRIIAAAREANPAVKLVGLTATPERGDGKRLGGTFACVADQIAIGELIEAGFIVRPRALVADVGLADQMQHLPRTNRGRGDFDMIAAAQLIDIPPVTARILDLWQEAAALPGGGIRRSIFFCATVAHAQHVRDAIAARGILAGVVFGEQDPGERAGVLSALRGGRLDVVVNCMTLTEGFDEQSLSCVVMLRPSAFRSLVIQCVGRGLRIQDPELYPDLPPKTDCLVLDFGASLDAMGGLDSILQLGGPRRAREPGPPPMKPCADCRRPIPLSARDCPLCGYVYPPRAAEAIPDIDPSLIRLRPFDLTLRASPFVWLSLGPRARVACSDRTWSIVFSDLAGTWFAFGSTPIEIETDSGSVKTDARIRHLAAGTLDMALAAGDDFLGEHGDARAHGRSASGYHRLPATDKQLKLAAKLKIDLGDRPLLYGAACRITARLAGRQIRAMLPRLQAAAPADAIAEVAA